MKLYATPELEREIEDAWKPGLKTGLGYTSFREGYLTRLAHEKDSKRLEWLAKTGARISLQEGSVGYPDICEVYERGRGLPSGVAPTFRGALDIAMSDTPMNDFNKRK